MTAAPSGSSPRPPRYGLIGSGMMGQEHIRNVALLRDIRIAALSDPDRAMRDDAALLAGPDVDTFRHHHDLLERRDLDALVIASPNHTHADILIDALATDLPILVEKPLCTTSADCRRVLEAANGRAAPVWVAMEYRYMPPVARLIETAGDGSIGRLRMVSIREHRFPFLGKVGGWNRLSRLTGGTMVEKCCHFFDLMRLIVGAEPTRIFASGGHDVNHLDETVNGEPSDILDNAFVTVDFANGVRAMLELCMFAEGSTYQEEITVVGDRAKVDARVPGPERFRGNAPPVEAEVIFSPRLGSPPRRETPEIDPAILHAGDHHGSTFFQHAAFRDLVLGGGEPAVTLEDGFLAVAMGEAAEESVRTGQPVTISAAPSSPSAAA